MNCAIFVVHVVVTGAVSSDRSVRQSNDESCTVFPYEEAIVSEAVEDRAEESSFVRMNVTLL
jgi:hypothetical protein